MHKNQTDESVGLFRLYFGFDLHRILIFVLIVGVTTAVVSGLYVSIFGLDTWTSNMSQAGSLMLANFPAPANNNANIQFNGVNNPNPPAENEQLNLVPQLGQQPAVNAVGQFICPNCGPIGLPNWDANGTPYCPNCGMVMTMGGQNHP